MTYQGPNASVTQEFVVSPGAVAIESLPSAAAATAYDVYRAKAMGTSYGLLQRSLAWGTTNKVVYNETVAGYKALNMYPPVAYANSPFGNTNLGLESGDFMRDGITIYRDSMYVLPGTIMAAGSCQAILPFYTAIWDDAAVHVTIPAGSLNTVIIAGGSVVTSRIKPGQQVFISNDEGDTWVLVGTVGSIGNDETKIYLAQAYAAPINDGDGILVGCANGTTLSTFPEVLYDANANFITTKVRVGDIISMSSLSISGSVVTPLTATVTAIINKNTLRFNTELLPAGSIDTDFAKYFAFTTPVGATVNVYTYSINRLVGFSQSYALKLLGDKNVGVDVTYIAPNSFSIPKGIPLSSVLDPVPALSKGDIFMIAKVNVGPTEEERDVSYPYPCIIDTISFDGSIYTITTVDPIYVTGEVTPTIFSDDETGDFIQAWHPIIETGIVADFRAIRAEEHAIVHRVASMQDIYTYWVRSGETTIDPRNELAFMMSILWAASGQKVCYGINADSSASNLTTEYAACMEALKMFDVYSHCFGTTDEGVNGTIGAYCDEQAEPYEGHERTGIVCYDLDDIYLMGTDTGGSIDEATGVITLAGGFDPLTAGVTVNDKVNIFNSDNQLLTTVTVVATPITTTTVITDYRGDAIASPTFKFESGRKDDQAVRGGSIKYGNRRVTMLWPGWFYATYSGVQSLFPPYFIAACIAGMDSGKIASQSLTNMPFSIPGLSNLQMNTSSYFRKAQLDEIGGGGVDIMIQDASLTQSIKSRHDLTTNMDAVQYRERSITKQADVCAKTIRAAVSPYVGRYNINDPNLFRFLGQVCSVVCTKLMKSGIISSITVTKIVRDEVIDDKLNIYVTAIAYIAGNYYDITLLIKTR